MLEKINKLVILMFLIIVLLISGTVAYLIYKNNGENNKYITLDNINIEYIDGESINTSNMQVPINSDDVLDYAPNNTFSVKNNNSKEVYLRFKITDLIINSDTEIVYNDFNFRYVLYYDDNITISEGCFENYDKDNKELIIATNIKQDALSTINYKLYIYIRDNGRDQNHFLNKNISGKIKVEGYDKKLPTLIDAILANNVVNETAPDFNTTTFTDEGLFKGVDADGETYYFRGAVEDNYVNFANMLWRIVRINGDGTIRLIANDIVGTSAFNEDAREPGYTYNNKVICTSNNYCDKNIGTNSTIKKYLDNWYITNMADYDSLIASTRYCNDTSVASTNGTVINYGANNRLMTNKKPQFICPNTDKNYGGEYNLKIGLLSMDEVAFAGGKYGTTSAYYLNRNTNYWLGTPNIFSGTYAYEFYVSNNSSSSYTIVVYDYAVVPVINLKKDVLITLGNGEKSNPYIIKTK